MKSILILIAAVLILTGCSGGNPNQPVAPSVQAYAPPGDSQINVGITVGN